MAFSHPAGRDSDLIARRGTLRLPIAGEGRSFPFDRLARLCHDLSRQGGKLARLSLHTEAHLLFPLYEVDFHAYAVVSEEQCGNTEFCGDCILRQAVNSANHDQSVFRKKYKMTLDLNGKHSDIDFFVTASPINYNGHDLFLMVLEDITELTALRVLATICTHCKNVRNEEGNWEKIHEFLARKENILFSHGFCPECGLELYPNFLKNL